MIHNNDYNDFFNLSTIKFELSADEMFFISADSWRETKFAEVSHAWGSSMHPEDVAVYVEKFEIGDID